MNDDEINGLILVFPTLEYEADILSFRREFLDEGETMAGTSGLRYAGSVEEWIEELIEQRESNIGELVQASTFLCVRQSDDRVVGMINIRHHLNDYLRSYGGHIGYSIRRSERRKGYGKAQLKLGISICRKLKLSRVLITCNKENSASAAVIKCNGGVLRKEKNHEAKVVQLYWLMIN